MNALELKNLTKSFPGFRLEPLNLTLPQGCIMGLIGENGAGKSTILKLILNMLHPDGGTITILGRDQKENLRLTKEEIGVVPDEVGLPECLNTSQVGAIMAGTFRNWDAAVYDRLLRSLSIPADRAFKDFSRGTKMKLGIAVALSHHPKLLLLDEATNGLDPVARNQVVELLYDFTRDETHSVLISSHIVSDLEKLCDYITFVHRGKLLLCEEKDVLTAQYGLLHCTRQELSQLPASAVKSKKESAYGVDAVVLRGAVPAQWKPSPITIEELFVAMAKEVG